jgi:hypothetical protein
MLEKLTLDMLLEVVGEVITEPEILVPSYRLRAFALGADLGADRDRKVLDRRD